MGIVFRQSVKTTIVIAAGAVLGAVINLIYAYVLTKQQFGYVRTITIQAVLVHMFVMLGLGSTLLNFWARYTAKDERRKVLITLNSIAPLVTTLLLSIPYFVFKESVLNLFNTEDQAFVRRFYPVVPLFILLWAYIVAVEAYLVTQSKVAVLSFLREVVLRAFNILLIGLFYLDVLSFPMFIYGFVGSHLAVLLLLLLTARKTEDFGFSSKWKIFNRNEYKEIASYSWYHMLVSSTIYMLGYIDTMMLGSRLSLEGLSSVAVYTNATFIVSLMAIPYRAMNQSSIPTLNRVYLSGDRKELADIFHRTGINIFIAAVAMFLLVTCNLDNAVAILPKDYAALKPIVLILMIGRMIDMATGLNTELTSVSKYYKFNFRISLLLLVMLICFCYILIPIYGIYGAAWATTVALAIFNIAKMLFLWIKMQLHPFTKQTLLVILAGAIAFPIGYMFPYMLNPVIDAVVRSLVVVTTFGGLIIWLKPSVDVSAYIATVIKNKRLF